MYFFLLFSIFFGQNQMRALTMSYFKLVRSNLEILSGLCPCMFGATMANKIQASVALLVSKCVSIFDSVLPLQIGN